MLEILLIRVWGMMRVISSLYWKEWCLQVLSFFHLAYHNSLSFLLLSPISEVSYLFAEMVQHGLRCIAFCRSRKLCELVLCYTYVSHDVSHLQYLFFKHLYQTRKCCITVLNIHYCIRREILEETAPHLVNSICAYRAGYVAEVSFCCNLMWLNFDNDFRTRLSYNPFLVNSVLCFLIFFSTWILVLGQRLLSYLSLAFFYALKIGESLSIYFQTVLLFFIIIF